MLTENELIPAAIAAVVHVVVDWVITWYFWAQVSRYVGKPCAGYHPVHCIQSGSYGADRPNGQLRALRSTVAAVLASSPSVKMSALPPCPYHSLPFHRPGS